ncbi:MAG: PEGA domain-containing protein [Deltaproteobacteria bacterium]|nr:PEGA domain-containing protein [Deltaproteobacteria bacterium]
MKSVLLHVACFVACCLVLLPCRGALAKRAKVLVILDLHDSEGKLLEKDTIYLTESIYAAATSFSPESISVVSREKLNAVLAKRQNPSHAELNKDEIGALLGADFLFTGKLTNVGTSNFTATLKLTEVGTGRLLGLEHAEAADLARLSGELQKLAREILATALGEEQKSEEPPQDKAEEEVGAKPEEHDDFLVQFRVAPPDATIEMDGRKICEETPCSYRIERGTHRFVIEAEFHTRKAKDLTIDSDKELAFELESRTYSYFGMNDMKQGGWLITMGVSPLDTDYRSISAIDGFVFARLHPIIDVGIGGGVFGYRQAQRGSSWSILGIGPSVRVSRLIISSQVQLLSFRHKSDGYGKGWLPGITVQARLPFINKREIDSWAALVPVPTIGLDVWLHGLNHDQTQFWVGLSWPGGVDF